MTYVRSFVVCLVACLICQTGMAQDHLESLKEGEVPLQFAGPMAFGPDGVLFVGDPMAASVHAIDTGERDSGDFPSFSVERINQKIASALGTNPDQININDMVVSPISGRVFLSVTRGTGAETTPLVLRVSPDGSLDELNLKNVPHATVSIPNAPAEDAEDRRGRPLRMVSITDLSLIDNQVVVAGLSNEEFASTLRAIPYPFAEDVEGTALEVYHGAHGQYETNAPVRTFAGISIENEPYVVAAYTCTPLVRFPLSEVTSGEKIRGTTVAELGNWNSPLDMFVYEKDGKKFILMANTKRGMMKISTEGIGRDDGITQKVSRGGTEGQPYEVIDELNTAVQLDRYGDDHAVVILKDEDSGQQDLKVVPLP